MTKKTVTIPASEYKRLKKKAELSEGLLASLVKGLEDIKHGRVKEWKGIKPVSKD